MTDKTQQKPEAGLVTKDFTPEEAYNVGYNTCQAQWERKEREAAASYQKPVTNIDVAEVYVPEGYVLVSLDSEKKRQSYEEYKELFVSYLDWNNAQEIYSPHGSGRMVPILCHKPMAVRQIRPIKQESSNE